MQSFKPAPRGRIPRFFLLSALLLPVSLHSHAAFSASLTVKIRQLNPDGQIQQATCTDNKKCLLPIVINTAQAQTETLNVHVLFVPGNTLFEFETPKGYLYASDNKAGDKYVVYETIWHRTVAQNQPPDLTQNKSSVSDVKLFFPPVPHAETAPILNAGQQPVANLEITTEESP